jgi:hypothetical protein
MGSTLVSTGERIAIDNLKHVFVHGAYNLGPVYENREIITTTFHPGEHIMHVATAGGEDNYVIGTDKTPYSYGVAEIDFLQISSCATDYTLADDIPGIPYHMNFGAYLRNIQCADPAGSDVSPDEPLSTDSGTAGSYIAYHTETTMVDSDTSDGEAYAAGVVISDKEAAQKVRTFLKQAYFLTDPSAVYTTVAYIVSG